MSTHHDGRTCLSVQQPWAWLLCAGFKDVENRTWRTPYRGALYIHAGKTPDIHAHEFVANQFPEIALPPLIDLHTGGIVGRVNLTGCVTGDPSRWARPCAWHWKCTEGEHLTFEPMRGRLGLFIAGNQKCLLEVPPGYTVKTKKIEPSARFVHGTYCASLFFGDVKAAIFESYKLDRAAARMAAIKEAHRLAALPGLQSFHEPDCKCHD